VTDLRSEPGLATARGDAPEPEDLLPADHEVILRSLRPMGPGAVLDSAFDLLRLRFRRLVGVAACLFVPVRILDLVTMIATGDATERYHVGPALLLLGGDSGWSWLIVVLQSLALSVLGLCVGHLVQRLVAGADASFRELMSLALRRGWVALAILPLTFVIRAPLSCIPLGFLAADALVFTTSVVAGAERLGPWRALRRSIALSRRAFGRMLAVVLGGLLISQLLRISFYSGPVALAANFSTSGAVLTAVGQAGSLVVLVAEPLTACIAARAYLDLRCRNEGLDLRLRLHERFGTVTRSGQSTVGAGS
jgi:hypothetical protein